MFLFLRVCECSSFVWLQLAIETQTQEQVAKVSTGGCSIRVENVLMQNERLLQQDGISYKYC